MNERIRELAEQARIKDHWSMDERRYLTNYLDEQKFAELIVKECASICELNGQSYTHSFTPAKARLAESTSNHCAMMIKKHFRVES
jgi:hypothetical protein